MVGIILSLLCIAPVFAGTQEEQATNVEPGLPLGWQANVGIELYSFKYREPGLMEDTGLFYGVKGSAYYFTESPVFFGGDARFSLGEVDYDGQTWGGSPLSFSGIDDWSFELRGVLGMGAQRTDDEMIKVYVGLGYRYLNDDSSPFPGGYERESNYFYSPLGVDYTRQLSRKWSVGVSLEYDFFWSGLQRSHLYPGLLVVENDQKDGYGIRGAVRLIRERRLFLEAFVRYWDIDESDVQWGLVEPANETTEIGVLVGMTF